MGALILGLLALVPYPVTACTIDSVPSATASGRTAILYDIAPDSVDPAYYAPFIFPGSFGAGRSIRFGEFSQGLSLTARRRHAPWRWNFGDGTTSWGHSVPHAYRTPGLYVLTVSAYVPRTAAPFPFDRVLVRVLAPNQILATEGPNLLNGSHFDPDASLLGGLLPLQREADKGLLDLASQIESGAWASIRDYWRHTRGGLPAAYARVDALLRQEGAALDAHNQHQAAAIADGLPAAWDHVNPQRAGIAWLALVGGVAGVLLALIVANELRRWRALARRERLRNARMV